MKEPPRSYSVDDDLKVRYGDRIGPKLDVFLNGRLATRVIAYDCDAGTIERFVDADGGGVAFDRLKGEAITERVRGCVSVRWRHQDADA